MGHWDLLVTQTYPNQEATTAPVASRVASAARAASSKSGWGKFEVLLGACGRVWAVYPEVIHMLKQTH